MQEGRLPVTLQLLITKSAWLRPKTLPGRVLQIILLAAAYFALARLGLALAVVNASVSPVWPPTGLAIAALLLFGMRAWPGIFLGAFTANLLTTGFDAAAIGIAAGNTLEATAVAWLALRYAGGMTAFNTASGVFRYAVAAFLGTTISATFGLASLLATGHATAAVAAKIWWTWWLGDTVGALIIAPFLIVWATPRPSHQRPGSPAEWALIAGAAVVIASIIFTPTLYDSGIHGSVAVFTVPLIVWAGFRLGRRGASTMAIFISAAAIYGTIQGEGPFVASNANNSLLLLQSFMGVANVMALTVAAVVLERQTASHATESLLKNVLDNSPDSVYVKDLTGHYLLANPAMHAALGRAPGTIVGLDGSSWMSPEVFAATHADDGRVIASGTTINTEYTFEAKGRRFTFNTIKIPYRDPAGKIIGVLEVSRDVTRRKTAEEALQRVDRFKTQFINTAAHELRTPLLPLRMQLDFLMTDEDHPPTPPHLEAMEVMRRNLDRLSGLVEDLLVVARSQAGRIQLDVAPTDLANVLREAEQTFHALAIKRGIRVTVDGDPMPLVLADSKRIGQVVTNLLSNAFKFTPDGGHISVVLQSEGTGARVTVNDTGIGIPPTDIARLFQPFVQVHDATHVTQPGSGLGLYICKQMVDLHGGAIGCTSPGRGKGSTFWFTIPGIPLRPASDDSTEWKRTP